MQVLRRMECSLAPTSPPPGGVAAQNATTTSHSPDSPPPAYLAAGGPMGRDGFPDAEQHGLCPFHLLRAHHTQWCAEARIHLFVDACMHCVEEQVSQLCHISLTIHAVAARESCVIVFGAMWSGASLEHKPASQGQRCWRGMLRTQAAGRSAHCIQILQQGSAFGFSLVGKGRELGTGAGPRQTQSLCDCKLTRRLASP